MHIKKQEKEDFLQGKKSSFKLPFFNVNFWLFLGCFGGYFTLSSPPKNFMLRSTESLDSPQGKESNL
jgi:hypothetical protein